MTRTCLLILVCGFLVITSAEIASNDEQKGSWIDVGPTPQTFWSDIRDFISGAFKSMTKSESTTYGGPKGPSKNAGPGPHLFGSSVTAFSLDIIKSVSRSESPTDNILFSPSSLYKTLLAVYLGSSGDGKTNLASTLHLENAQFDVAGCFKVWRKLNSSIIQTGEKLFYDGKYRVKRAFKALLEDNFRGILTNKTKSNEMINKWATRVMGYKNHIVTEKQIHSMKLLPISLSSSKYNLTRTFENIIPTSLYFSPSTGGMESVESMEILDTFKYFEDSSLKAKVLSIQYKESQSSFIILLPDLGKTVRQLIDSLTVDNIADIFQNLKDTQVLLQMPQIKTEQLHNITNMCETFKICNLLEENNNGLQGITSNSSFLISDFVHKVRFHVFAEVDGPVAQPVYTNKMLFSVSRPFIYMVYDNQENMLKILGTMMNPKQ